MTSQFSSSRISIPTLSEWLFTKNQRQANYKRQSEYSRCISVFLSAYGGERVILVGSTTDDTRFMCDWDEGDYDYLMISEVKIPVEALEYRPDVPCFVHICGGTLKNVLPCQLMRNKYVPSRLVRDVEAPAFHQIKGILQLVSRPACRPGRFLQIDTPINPGKSLTTYKGFSCPEFESKGSSRMDNAVLLERISAKLESIGNKDGLAVVAMLAEMLRQLHLARPADREVDYTIPQGHTIIDTLDTILNGSKESEIDYTQTIKKPKVGKESSVCQPQVTELYSREESTNKTGTDDDVIGTYNYKANKDFIGAFPLQGDLPCLVDWGKRERKWPALHVVDEIMKCEIFLVAKPAASSNPDPDIDFCLAFTLAEITLAKNLTKGQKLCILMIKALLRSSFEKYSDNLTTFHWKTALYWVSETEGADVFNENDPIPSLKMLLEYMQSRLEERFLCHYFIMSNLLCGSKFDDATVDGLVSLIKKVRNDPIEALMTFYRREEQQNGLRRTIAFPRWKVEELKVKILNNPDEALLDRSVECLKYLLTDTRPGGDRSCTRQLQEGINKLMVAAIPVWLEEERYVSTSGASASSVTVKKPAAPPGDINALIQLGLNYMAMPKDGNKEERKKALDNLRRDGLSMLFALKK